MNPNKFEVEARELFTNLNAYAFDEETWVINIADALRSIDSAAREDERGKVTGETSDGYHTFNELYDHRVLLWINLCLLQHPGMTYLVENHFDGWFLLGVETPNGQLSYHCPNKYLHLVEGIRRRHPEFDGHTSADVLKRLEAIAIRARSNGLRGGVMSEYFVPICLCGKEMVKVAKDGAGRQNYWWCKQCGTTLGETK